MPDTITGAKDSGLTAAPNAEGVTKSPADADSDKLALLEQRLKDAQGKVSAMGVENARLKSEKDKLLMDSVTKLTEAMAAKSSRKDPDEVAAQRKELLKMLDERGDEGVIDLMTDGLNTVKADIEKAITEQLKAEADARRKLETVISDMRLEASPEYQSRKEQVAKLVEVGLTREQAIQALKIIPVASITEEGHTPPAGTSSSRAVAPQRTQKLSDEDKQRYRALGLTAVEIAAIEGDQK